MFCMSMRSMSQDGMRLGMGKHFLRERAHLSRKTSAGKPPPHPLEGAEAVAKAAVAASAIATAATVEAAAASKEHTPLIPQHGQSVICEGAATATATRPPPLVAGRSGSCSNSCSSCSSPHYCSCCCCRHGFRRARPSRDRRGGCSSLTGDQAQSKIWAEVRRPNLEVPG